MFFLEKKEKIAASRAGKILVEMNGDIIELTNRKEVPFNCNKSIYFFSAI